MIERLIFMIPCMVIVYFLEKWMVFAWIDEWHERKKKDE